ncbi:hypothetical protein [Chryseobacterium sp. W4I1]|uniref:hypothetical protein n=1 Tax=Chryseobacterium sp. W4I1 TaxID=3042293 RepID=UPI002781DF55|nr:hypothetical protein [Chryseobacterium sp. W4I1]MDQ0781405.1 hypothetical protein [Chryseobacterium sp. W4I1]
MIYSNMEEKTYSSNWELLPGVGLGRMAFLMSRLQMKAFDDFLSSRDVEGGA